MRRFLFVPVTLFLLLLSAGCKNDIDLLADYKTTIVCYGLLNPYDSVQYVRISRVFSGEGNALEMAQVPDSTGFPPGTLEVKVERWYDGVLQQTFFLTRDTMVPREEGIFPAPRQVLYRGVFPVLKDGSTYKITIHDLARELVVTSETGIVQDVTMINPSSPTIPLNFEDTTNIQFRFKTGTNGLRYHFTIRFHYTDQFIFDTTQISQQYFDWDISELTALSDAGGEQLQIAFARRNFLQAMVNNIPVSPYLQRISGGIDLIFTGATQDVATYIDVQTANASSSADLPPYTNIEGGIGLFASRTTTFLPHYLLDPDTRFTLTNDPVTQPLNFIR